MRLVLAASFVVALLGGCSQSPTVAPAFCATDPRVETFQTGMTSKGAAGAVVTISSATPSVVQQGLNEWVVTITDSSGNPVSGTVNESAFMPDHGHGSPTLPTITPKGNGQYDISEINLSMSGVWTITITVASPSLNDSATFTFCIDGTTS
jgi:hypothetical protein